MLINYCVNLNFGESCRKDEKSRIKESQLRTKHLPESASQMWIRPSVDPENTNFESGEKQPSTAIPLLFKWPAKVCKGCPWKASIKRITLPLVVKRIDCPLGLNLRPVHSHCLSWGRLNVTNGPLSNDRRS